MGNGIHRDVLNLTTFNFDTLNFDDLAITSNISYKENAIQFINVDFGDTTFRLEMEFIDKCRLSVQKNGFFVKYENELYTKIEVSFKNCKFSNFIIKDNIIKDNIHFDYDKESTNLQIEKFIILGSTVKGKFYINKQYAGNNKALSINSLKIEDTVFEDNFKLHHVILAEFNVEDTDFKKHADFFKSKFLKGTLDEDQNARINQNDIGFKAINFKGLALFGDTEFHKKLIFKYITFESFSHFRKSKLYDGLDLDYSNIQEEMNFFDVEYLDKTKAKKNTSQETYRIIKHNFEKIGNKIEANKYHALELKKYRTNIWKGIKNNLLYDNKPSSSVLDGIVTLFHWISSNHSTNWLLVLVWIFMVGLLTTIGMTEGFNIYDINTYSLIEKGKVFINMQLIHFGHDTFTFVINYNEYKLNYDLNFEDKVILFINKISLGYLYYQFLLSIRKDTRK